MLFSNKPAQEPAVWLLAFAFACLCHVQHADDFMPGSQETPVTKFGDQLGSRFFEAKKETKAYKSDLNKNFIQLPDLFFAKETHLPSSRPILLRRPVRPLLFRGLTGSTHSVTFSAVYPGASVQNFRFKKHRVTS